MFFEKLVEQHGVDLLVADRVRRALLVANDQVGIYLFHFLGHQPKLRDALRIDLLFVAECDWLQREERFAGLGHGLNFVFEPRRGGARAQLAVSIYKDRSASGSGLSTDAGNVGGSDERFADANCAAVAGNARRCQCRYYHCRW